MNQIAIDFIAAKQQRDAAIARAVEHADAVQPSWSDHAYAFLIAYLRAHASFTTEQVRDAAAGTIPEPPSRRAWGSVTLRAVRAGLIIRKGYVNAHDPKVHCNVVTLWQSQVAA